MSAGASDDWDQHWGHYAESAESNPAQRYRIRLMFPRLALGRAKARVVDIGSGQGDMAALIRRRASHAEILGIELSEEGCRIASTKVPDAVFIQRDLVAPTEGPPPGFKEWATHAVCSEVLEHVDRPDLLLRNAKEYLGPGCRLVVTVPGGPMSRFDRHIGHRRHFDRTTLRSLLTESGLEVDRVSAAGFPFHSMYRLAVLARGDRLVRDASGPPSSHAMKVAMKVFDLLFRLNLPATPWGWQLVACARMPGHGLRANQGSV